MQTPEEGLCHQAVVESKAWTRALGGSKDKEGDRLVDAEKNKEDPER